VLAAAVAGIVVIGALAGGLLGAGAAAGIALVTLPLLVDGALGLLAPIEDRIALGFVRQAEAKVARVAPTIVAITGSYGKTTTKQYAAHLLAGRFSVLASPRSFNNRAGLARSVNELLLPGTDVFIAEMGTYGRGEIAALCAWLPPKVAVITAIGPVHLERFKRLEVTVEAKAEISERAEVTVVNVDDDRLAELADRLERAGRSVVRASALDAGAPVAVLATDDGLALYRAGVFEGRTVVALDARPPAPSNAACAAAVALTLGAPPDEVLARLAALPNVANRLEASRSASGAMVLDDTFNSNPAGAALAVGELGRAGSNGGRRVVVTPGMVELGPLQASENERFARDAAAVATDVVIVGRTNRRALSAGVRAAQAAGSRVALRLVATRDEAVAFVRRELGADDVVLYENDLPDHYP
jgi:UDP-N-acetylmuramoyl-tripeptide--D-alanyl-D-alanine ligase